MAEKRVLVVDDEDDIREVVQLSLEVGAGWEVLAAASGPEGIELARSVRPDAILLDVMMPEMDGPTTVLALQADATTRAIPVVLLTAKLQPADRRRFQELGVAGLIAKPFDPLTLHEQLSRTVGWLA